EAGGSLPHAARGIGAGEDARHRARGDELLLLLAQRIEFHDPREEEGGIRAVGADRGESRGGAVALRGVLALPAGWRVDEEHGAAALAVFGRTGDHVGVD